MSRHFVAIDLGASSTRFASNNGKIDVLPNNMVYVEPDTLVDQEPYSNEVEAALDVTIECEHESEFFPCRALVGQMAERYSPTNQKPSLMANKHKQKINYVSAVIAMAVSKMRHGLDNDLKLYLALPPVEVKVAKEVISKHLVGNYTVRFNKMDNTEVKFRIEDVSIYEESFMAMLAYFFDKNGRLREQAKQFANGNILSMDIGASTTDLAVVQNMRYLEKSGQTYKIGGNVARDTLMDRIRGEFGFDAPIDMAEMVMAEGRIQLGNVYQDCSEAVRLAKREFAEQIVEQIQGYFRKVNIPIQTIRAIVVSGGGSMSGQYVDGGEVIITSEPMSHFITEELNKICPGVVVEQFSENPRMANITGLYIRANIDIRKNVGATQQDGAAVEKNPM